jgi:putative tricarboxylic transport membrane protein
MTMVLLGLLLGTIGMDSITGTFRFTFELAELNDGIGFVPVAMGVFGFGEILASSESDMIREVYRPRLRELLPNKKEFMASIAPTIRGSFIGFFIGLLPGAAHVLASFVSYITEKKIAKNPEEFGHGRVEGIAGPETANNAATGGAMVPFLALGIPTGPAIAIMMIALLLHGIRPGPLMITEQPELFWGLIASMYIGNIILVFLNLPLVGIFVSLLRVPFRILMPVILLICMVGTYSVELSSFQMGILVAAGVLGYLLRKFEYDLAPFILALILGPAIEETFRQTLIRSNGSFNVFLKSPIALTFLVISGMLLLWNAYRTLNRKEAKRDGV